MPEKSYVYLRFDVTGLTESERDGVVGEALVMAEGSESHPDVEGVEVAVDAAVLRGAFARADALASALGAADALNGADDRDDIYVEEILRTLDGEPSGSVANVLLDGPAAETMADAIRARGRRIFAASTNVTNPCSGGDESPARAGVREEAGMLWFDPYVALYDPYAPGDEPLFLMYGDDEGGTFFAPGTTDVGEFERRLVRFLGDDGWTIDDYQPVHMGPLPARERRG